MATLNVIIGDDGYWRCAECGTNIRASVKYEYSGMPVRQSNDDREGYEIQTNNGSLDLEINSYLDATYTECEVIELYCNNSGCGVSVWADEPPMDVVIKEDL